MKRFICGPMTVLVKHGRLCLVTLPSTIQSARIQVLTRGRQSVFTTTICRWLRQRIHLAEPKRCLDKAGHLSVRPGVWREPGEVGLIDCQVKGSVTAAAAHMSAPGRV